jgi:hypothetical protein
MAANSESMVLELSDDAFEESSNTTAGPSSLFNDTSVSSIPATQLMAPPPSLAVMHLGREFVPFSAGPRRRGIKRSWVFDYGKSYQEVSTGINSMLSR